MKGNLLVITGPMYGGKSLDLIEEIKGWEDSKDTYLAFSPIKDKIFSRATDVEIPAIQIPRDFASMISYMVGSDIKHGIPIKAVAIDEVSFYETPIVGTVLTLLDEGINVAVAGLDQDFRGKPFGSIGDLLILANDVHRHYSMCMKCKTTSATMTQRLLNGKAAPFNGPLIIIDNEEEKYTYECRCRNCHEKA
jgi:thymidine kinase